MKQNQSWMMLQIQTIPVTKLIQVEMNTFVLSGNYHEQDLCRI